MFVEYGKVKMILVVLQGLLTPLQTPAADFLPDWVKLVASCVQGASIALFAYLLKPAAESQLSVSDLGATTDVEIIQEVSSLKSKGDK